MILISTPLEHDQIWVSDFQDTVPSMSVAEVAAMAELGWFEDEDSWSHFS
jgi:hypothetical protein